MEDIRNLDQIKRNFSRLRDLAFKRRHRQCLFDPDCSDKAINAHSVSEAILSQLCDSRHILSPVGEISLSKSGNVERILQLEPVGVGKASTGTFACQDHDLLFKSIDTTPVDTDDNHVLNLMFYRALLREAWALLSTKELTDELEEQGRIPGPLTNHPQVRLLAIRDSMAAIKPYMDRDKSSLRASPISHIVRRIRTARPIVAASAAGASLDMGFEQETGRLLSASETRALTGKNPNNTWAITIVPQDADHIVAISWITGTVGDQCFSHLREVNGRELEEAVSAELIRFCENWFLHPKVWTSFSKTKQDAILRSYDNIDRLIQGPHQWHDKSPNTKWYEHIDLPNWHQINLFRYNESVFK